MMRDRDLFYDTRSVIKDFRCNGRIFSEKVAMFPKVMCQEGISIPSGNGNSLYPEGANSVFSLRIDVDEVQDERVLLDYFRLFEKYREWVTLFCSAGAFLGKEHLLRTALDMGLDIQSHGYYHYTHNDYDNIFNNLNKAKTFFDANGISTRGFASPMGKYNCNLMKALEDLGYVYSSDFSFDYLNFPHYPKVGDRFSRVLQVPIFPVCPELLFFHGFTKVETLDYFVGALDDIAECRLPAIMYAHTNKYCDEVLEFLENFLPRVRSAGGLYRCNVTKFAEWCLRSENKKMSAESGLLHPAVVNGYMKLPKKYLLGEIGKRSMIDAAKDKVREAGDLENIVPFEELLDSRPRLLLKKMFRLLTGKTEPK